MTEATDRLRILIADAAVGTLGRGEPLSHSVFSYSTDAVDENSISLTMPTRLESYVCENDIHPVFQMNLPEGVLRDDLGRRFSKAVKDFDDFALLGVVGRYQLGRLAAASETTPDRMPGTSLADLLVRDAAQGLFKDLLDANGQYPGFLACNRRC